MSPFATSRRRVRVVAVVSAGVVLAGGSSAVAHDGGRTGGAAAPEPPEIAQVRCDTGDAGRCARRSVLRIGGENLAGARAVIFFGRRGRRDDRRAAAVVASQHRVVVRVPAHAVSGAIAVVSTTAEAPARGPQVRIVKAEPGPATAPSTVATAGFFPIQGAHDYGTATNRFGGGRGHEGQDVFATCGTPLVAALAGVVTLARYQDRAGNYLVIKADDGTSQAYMHMLEPASVAKGQRVEAGQPIGKVGQTGRASGCHLHFELWTAPGWYEGGEAVDPLPLLRRLEKSAPPPSSPA